MKAVAMVFQYTNVVPLPRSNRPSNKSKAKRVNFTQMRVEALHHSGKGRKPEYVYDAGKPGLAIRLTTAGARTYVFVGRLHGKLAPRIPLGRVEGLKLAKARAAIDKIRGDAALGIDVVAERKALKQQAADRETLDQAFAEFVAGERHRPKTVRDYRCLWALYVAGTLGSKIVSEVTAEDVKKLHVKTAAAVVTHIREKSKVRAARAAARAKQAGGRGEAVTTTLRTPTGSEDWKGHRTANKTVALLRAVLSFAGRKGDNPAREVIWFKQAPRRRRLSDEEATKFRNI
jgi:hypothetical protein